MFWTLHDFTVETLQTHAVTNVLPVDERFSLKEGVLRRQPMVMTNIAFETEKLRKVRLTYMDAGEAAQILTTMAFPRFNTDLPIFGADVLSFRGKPHLIVIDHQPLFKEDAAYAEKYIEPMEEMYKRFAHLPSRGRDLPAWTAEFFSPYTHYSRPTLDYLPEVLDAYRAYWSSYLVRVAEAECAEFPFPQIQNRQAAYCRNHVENEQAEGMLQKLFGEEWCEAYINEFLFDVRETAVV